MFFLLIFTMLGLASQVKAEHLYRDSEGRAYASNAARCRRPQIPLGRGCRYYWPMICAEARALGVDPELVIRVTKAESSCNPRAVSPKGAIGLMQLMPQTARRFGVGNPYHPAWNVRGGVTYLRFLLEYFRGDVVLAVAAYNAGEEAVDKYGRVPPYRETQNYVWRVLGRSPQSSLIIPRGMVYEWQGPDGRRYSSNVPPR